MVSNADASLPEAFEQIAVGHVGGQEDREAETETEAENADSAEEATF
jgi:hypothetical protein